ncbi:MAG: hypothetical protein J5J06_02880 [Phycisphaerae bacterium]|nr:hypothetical protein [Phycisphaerae bacterium]
MVREAIALRRQFGLPEVDGSLEHGALFLLDGVGGLQLSVVLARAALAAETDAPGTIVFRWQTPVMGEMLSDLMWLRRNKVQAAKLARRILAVRRAHPEAKIHVLAVSGGSGIAVFAMEALRGRAVVETLILACPALSPGYNLGPALQCVERAYALVSHRDRLILGVGTSVFGTVDRKWCASAGRVGFELPIAASSSDLANYGKFRELHWSEDLEAVGHHGSHAEWAGRRFLEAHLMPMLRGEPLIEARPITRRTADRARSGPAGGAHRTELP